MSALELRNELIKLTAEERREVQEFLRKLDEENASESSRKVRPGFEGIVDEVFTEYSDVMRRLAQ